MEEDFKVNSTSLVMALSMYDGDKIMVSLDPDIYKFRVMQKSAGVWREV